MRCWLLGLGLALEAGAELPVARLWTVFPPGGQSGKEQEVSVQGVDLDWPETLRFSHPGMTAQVKSGSEEDRQNLRDFVVKIGPDVPEGVYEVRVLSRFGISNARPFAVGRWPGIVLAGEEGRTGKPKQVSVNSWVHGRVPASDRLELHWTNAPKGEIEFVCQAATLDSKLEPVMIASDGQGRELGRSRRGGHLKLRLEEAQEVRLVLHDRTFRGGDEYYFRLSAGAPGYQALAFPPVLTAGQSPEVFPRWRGEYDSNKVLNIGKPSRGVPGILAGGRSLSALGLETLGVEWPEAGVGGWVGATDLKVILDESRPESPQKIPPPCNVAGRFERGRRTSVFEFEVKKGQSFELEVFSHRLGQSTDPHLLVQHLSGEGKVTEEREFADQEQNLGGHEFNTATRDPHGKVEVKADGRLRVTLSDLARTASSGEDPLFWFRVEQEKPDFGAFAVPVAPAPPNRDVRLATVWSTHLRRGERVPLQIFLRRRGGLTNAIRFEAEGLPEGMKCEALELAGDRASGWLMLEAAEGAPAWAGELRIAGRALGAASNLERRVSSGMVVWNVGDANNERVWTRLNTGLSASISGQERAALRLNVESNAVVEAKAGAKVSFPIRFDREEAFDRAVKLKPSGMAALDAAKEMEVAAKTNSALYELDLGQVKLATGEHVFRFEATSTGAYRRQTKAETEAIEAKAKEAEASTKQIEEELKLAKDAVAKAEAKEADAKKAKVKEFEGRKEKLAADIKRWRESIKPQDQTVRAWSGGVRLKVLP